MQNFVLVVMVDVTGYYFLLVLVDSIAFSLVWADL